MENHYLIDAEPVEDILSGYTQDYMYTIANSEGVGRYNVYRYLEFVELNQEPQDIRAKNCNRVLKYFKNK